MVWLPVSLCFLWRHSADKTDSVQCGETHFEIVASFGSQKSSKEAPKDETYIHRKDTEQNDFLKQKFKIYKDWHPIQGCS